MDWDAAASSARRASSRQSEMASSTAPQLTAISATLKVGQRSAPKPTSRKSTTPCGLRSRSIRLPKAPPVTAPSASWRITSPPGERSDIRCSTITATSAMARKIQREYGPTWRPKAAPGLYTSRSCTQSPSTSTPEERSSRASAASLVKMSSTTTVPAVPQNIRRSAALAILFLFLALDAQPRVRQGVESFEGDFVAAGVAVAELVGSPVEAPERFVDVPEV